jgi:phosphoribosylaminoimidazolecarboxamide formyltransferase/IMP cyclohydrolase
MRRRSTPPAAAAARSGGFMSASLRPLARALISVSDKAGLIDFAKALADRGVEIVSTGGTRKAIAEAGVPVIDVADLTGFPEMMDGRVKTLHPKVHGGLLAIRENPEHEASMLAHGIQPIDLLVVNLYPFEAAVAKGAAYDECVENIDIGGPAMIRAAAKNHADVAVVVDVGDFGPVLAELDAHAGATSLPFRKALAQKAYARTAAYDAAISNWFAAALGEKAPAFRAVGGALAEAMRYGENPHQSAGFYQTGEKRFGVATARQLQGKQLSYNNVNDTDAAFEAVAEFDPARTPAVVIVKHANPCGAAEGATLKEAYEKALRCDPVSAFGGIVALNRKLDAQAAAEIVKIFTEVIIAPEADEEAIALVAAKKNLRLLVTGGVPDPRAPGLLVRSVAGGLLVQSKDDAVVDDFDLRVVTRRAPSPTEMADLKFAFRVAKHVKSNAIVYAKDGATVGIGAGQMSRVDSSRIAAWKAAEAAKAAGLSESLAKGSVVASDAFFPFADGLLAAAEAGATAVIQPGGSMRDAEVVAAADEAGLAMVFTGVRHFRH